MPALWPLPRLKTLLALLPIPISTVSAVLAVSATVASPFLSFLQSWTARFSSRADSFFFVPSIVFSSILRVFSTSIFGRCSNACKRASRPRLRSCLKKLTHPRTCLGPVLLAVPNFWDSCYLALSLSVWYAGNRSHVASLHPKFAPRPFSESGLIGHPLRFFRA
jgi:hypothetical protein